MFTNVASFCGLALLTCLLPPASFGTVVTNTICTASFLTSSSSTGGPGSCSASAVIPDHPEFTVGGSNGSISNTTTLGDSFSSSFAYHVYAQVMEGSAATTVSGANTVQLSSGGPVRPGYLSITEDYFGISGLSVFTTTTLSLGSYNQACTQSTFGYPPAMCDVAPQNPTQTVIVPFTLGQVFTFRQTVMSSASVGVGTIPHYADGQLNVSIALLEGDPDSANLRAVRLVLADAPEPQSISLLGSGLFGLLFVVKRTRKT